MFATYLPVNCDSPNCLEKASLGLIVLQEPSSLGKKWRFHNEEQKLAAIRSRSEPASDRVRQSRNNLMADWGKELELTNRA